jgi:hypothetical protein
LIQVNIAPPADANLSPSSKRTGNQEASIMFIDEVVLAGIVTVGLMVLFCGGVGYFIWKDSHKKG